MKKTKIILSLGMFLAMTTFAWGISYMTGKWHNSGTALIVDTIHYIDANSLLMFVYNNGNFAYDNANVLGKTDGLYYPRGTKKTVIYDAGIWIGAKVRDSVRLAIAEYSSEFAPGPMKNGTFQPDQGAFKVYKIRRGDNAESNPDYRDWPADQGAPVDSLGNPIIQGDQETWSACNDADPSKHTNNAAATNPLGLEVHQQSFAYARGGPLGLTIFMKFKLINKGGNQLDSTYVSLWADPDLGDAGDDLVGCDTSLSLGYCYNSGADAIYGAAPPSVGFDFFQGPIVSGEATDSAFAFGHHLTEAIHLYLDFYRNGSDRQRWRAMQSFRTVCSRVFSRGGPYDPSTAADPAARRVIMAYIASKKCGLDDAALEVYQKWLDMVFANSPSAPAEEADAWAWAAYVAGDMETAAQWLGTSEKITLRGKWIRSKLLLRDGKIDEAVALLRSVVSAFPVAGSREIYYPSLAGQPSDNRMRDELGTLELGRKEYAAALDAFLRAGNWTDAAYVAERVLTSAELEQYVRRHRNDAGLKIPFYGWVSGGTGPWDSATYYVAGRVFSAGELEQYIRRYDKDAGFIPDRVPRAHPKGETGTRYDRLCYLLSRRLAREQQWDKAQQYCPPFWRPVLERYAGHLRSAEDKALSDRERGIHYFEAAKIARWYGLHILATELAPDWALYDAGFHLQDDLTKRLRRGPRDSEDLPKELNEALSPTEEERIRAEKAAPSPDLSYHYRYVASDLMWQAAELLPDNDPLTLRALYNGGVWVKSRSSGAPEKFYHALVRRCRELPYAREADKLHWFPKEPPK